MAATYIPIASTTLTTSTASVTFSAIPQTYTDLVLRLSFRTDVADTAEFQAKLKLNGSTAAIFSYTRLDGNGSTASSGRLSNTVNGRSGDGTQASNTSNTFGSSELYLPNYTASQNKPMSIFGVQETNATASSIRVYAQLWSSTAAISSMEINASDFGANFVSNSTFHLYGISNA